MNDLVERLSVSDHPVEVSLRPERTTRALRACLERGIVHIRFTDTRGGTELGMAVDAERTDLTGGDFTNASGTITLVGHLTLDFVKVILSANIDLSTLAGRGRLQRVEAQG